MVFTVLGAVAELERSLIVERVKAGLRNAKAKGNRIGQPRVAVDARRIAALRRLGSSWSEIARQPDGLKGRYREPITARQPLLACPETSSVNLGKWPAGISARNGRNGAGVDMESKWVIDSRPIS